MRIRCLLSGILVRIVSSYQQAEKKQTEAKSKKESWHKSTEKKYFFDILNC